MENIEIVETDKSKKIVIMSRSKHEEAINKHIGAKDKVIDEKGVKKLEEENKILCKSLQRIFKVGFDSIDQKQVPRITSTLTSIRHGGAKLSIIIKDHKDKDKEGNFKTRPVSNCIGSISDFG